MAELVDRVRIAISRHGMTMEDRAIAAVKEVESAVRAYMTWDEEGICEALAEQTAEGSEAKWPDAPFGGPRKKPGEI